jgi:hypothetical protein
MSVPKSKRSEGQLTVLVKANELATHTIKICSNEKNFPKHYRWCITNKIVDSALDINNYITMANAVFVTDKNDVALRKQFQTKAIAASYALLSMMDIAYRTFGIESKKIEYWTGLVIEVQNYLRNWKKSDAERYNDITG